MNLERYQIQADREQKIFDFISFGSKGQFHKRVIFSETSNKNLFNLSLADYDPKSGYLDYYNISDNGDRDKILATVVSCIYAFIAEYPDAFIYTIGVQ